MRHLALLGLLALAGDPATMPMNDKYIGVRKDVWDRVDGDSRKLEACERDLKKADEDLTSLDRHLRAHKMAIEMLKEQKAELKEFGDHHLEIAKKQRAYIERLEQYAVDDDPTFAEQAEAMWEWSDGPISFAGGFGLCLATVYALQPAFGQ